MRKFFYRGDTNIENGGLFYCLADWKYRYCDALRVTPASDAGGPDNIFWVEYLTVNIGESGSDRERDALQCIGESVESLAEMKPARQRHVLVDSHVAYGFYDVVRSDTIAIGEPSVMCNGKRVKPGFIESREGRFEIDKHLRGNTSLYRYARRELLNL